MLGFALLGYLCGSVSFAFWITRFIKGVDVRASGSHHATATNVVRQAGWKVGVVVMVLDFTKGFIPTYLAAHYAISSWAIPVTAVMVVFGHCWPLFTGFRGGMGLAASGGAALAISPFAFAIGVVLLISLLFAIRHAARACASVGLLTPVVLWLFHFPYIVLWTAVGVGLVLTFRYLIDWNRRYQSLWLDHEKVQ